MSGIPAAPGVTTAATPPKIRDTLTVMLTRPRAASYAYLEIQEDGIPKECVKVRRDMTLDDFANFARSIMALEQTGNWK